MKVCTYKVGQKYQLDNGTTGRIVAIEANRGAYLGHTPWNEYLSQFDGFYIEVAYKREKHILTETVRVT